MEAEIRALLSPSYPWGDRFVFLPQVDSTNDRLKHLAKAGAPHGTGLMADHQTGGHGRRGRSFLSPPGVGIYYSLLLRPDCAPTDLMHLTCAVATAVCDAIETSAGFRPGIKWTNDLVFGGRKLCGILTELGMTPQGTLDYVILGVGVNCCQKLEDFPPELRSFAGSLAMAAGHPVRRAEVAAAMMQSLCAMAQSLLTGREAMLRRYRRDCVTIGQEISLLRGDQVRHGRAMDVDDQGALVVAFPDGTIETVSSGEVSVRGMYGYV